MEQGAMRCGRYDTVWAEAYDVEQVVRSALAVHGIATKSSAQELVLVFRALTDRCPHRPMSAQTRVRAAIRFRRRIAPRLHPGLQGCYGHF
jgi:hypothetical protein